VLEIERGSARVFECGYGQYREARALLARQEATNYEAYQRRKAAAEQASERRMKLAAKVATAPAGIREGSDFYRRKAAKVARTARILRERVALAEEVRKPWEEQPIPDLDFGNLRRSGDIALSVLGVSKNYPQKLLFSNVTFHAARGDRIVIRGRNGSGKTTLLRIIRGLEDPDAGEIRVGANVTIGSFTQDAEDLDPSLSAIANCGSDTRARTLLACLKLRPERVQERVAELSAGERVKAALVKLLVSGANLLLLDEPTNHLEIEAQEALEQALSQFPGTILVASHDRSFLRALDPVKTVLDL